MAINPKLVLHGTAGGTAINVDMARIEHGAPVKVQLSASYAMIDGPGIPSRPSMTGAAAANLDYPRTIASGTTLSLLKGEADALVTAGKASYV
jgi:uncharacterized protein (DUF2345 family)